MKYKKAIGPRAKGRIMVQDYGHQWINELIRCGQDKNISLPKTAAILKTSVCTVKRHRRKLGLVGNEQTE